MLSFHITPAAAHRITALLATEQTTSFFRVNITGGGCSGFQYNFIIDDTLTIDDQTFEEHSAKVVIDDISLGLVSGGTLDFVQDLSASKFIVTNPNATAGCGCGNSFTL